MPRGRSKQPQAYSNRTDLQGKVAAAAPKGMPYGENKKLMEAQKAVPVSAPDTPIPPADAGIPTAQVAPVTPISLDVPSQRPNESILTGLNTTRKSGSDIQALKSFQPLFEAEALSPDAPKMFVEFTKWLRSQ